MALKTTISAIIILNILNSTVKSQDTLSTLNSCVYNWDCYTPCIQGSDCTKDENCLGGHCMPVPIWNGKKISMKYALKISENFSQGVNSKYCEDYNLYPI